MLVFCTVKIIPFILPIPLHFLLNFSIFVEVSNNTQYLQLLAKRLLLIYAVFFLCRVVFVVFNFAQFPNIGFWLFVQSFVAGFIFDTSAIVYVFGPLILWHLLPLPFKNNKWYELIGKLYFIVMVFLCLLANLIDVGYFPFNGRRSGVEVFAPINDISDQTWSYILSFWYLALILFSTAFLCWKIYPTNNIKTSVYKLKNVLVDFAILMVTAGVGVLGARGGVALKPISIFDAARFADGRLMSVTLNTPFQLLITSQLSDLEEKSYLSNEEALHYFNPIQTAHATDPTQKNVVLIILESTGKEYVGFYNHGKGYTPFLDSLIKSSVVFMHAYANGKRSIEGIPAIIASMPTSMSTDYINTRFQTNTLHGIGNYLSKQGYQSTFYHGCKNGTMGFNNFVAVTGSGNYFGLDEYPNKQKDFDGHWGIFDEPYLQYYANELSKQKAPFFSTVFTLSAHHPYSIPANRKKLFKPGSLPIHQSIRYADFALGQFFATASKLPWYNNTVFIITADHSAENETPYYQTQQGKYEIPFLIFDPSQPMQVIDTSTFQQADILPLILNNLYKGKYFAMSNYINVANRFAIQFVDGVYQLIQWPYVFQFDGNAPVALYNLRNDSLMKTNQLNNALETKNIDYLTKLTKSYIQQYNNSIIHNKTVAE